MQFIDSHAHLNAEQFSGNWENVVTEAKNAGLVSIINIGSDPQDSERGVVQANQEPIVYTTVGVHPESLAGRLPDMAVLINNLRRLISNSQKVVGIGEIGLDYTLDPVKAPKQIQFSLITAQITLALELSLPIVLHVRDQKDSNHCFDDLLVILHQFTTSEKGVQNSNISLTTQKLAPRLTGVFHCWTGTPAQVQIALNLGFYISFSGILTYKSAGHILDAAKVVPDHRLLIETDAPFLTPEPARSQQHPSTNQPRYVILTAEKLAQVRDTTLGHIAEITTANTKLLFNLP
jgi:TatD DNase family protein